MGEKVYERVHKVRYGKFETRVWSKSIGELTDESEDTMQKNEIKKAMAKAFVSEGSAGSNPALLRVMVEELALLSFCNAVEVQDLSTDRIVLIYPNWP